MARYIRVALCSSMLTLMILSCTVSTTATNAGDSRTDYSNNNASSLVGAVDLVYCFFDTSSVRVTSSTETHRKQAEDEFTKGRYVDSFTGHRTLSYLRYFLRAISKNMPWIRNLIVVVPDYDLVSPIIANNPLVTVLHHRDFIPKAYLPTFNEEVVLMFAHLIPNLSREFIYMNQHTYPIAPLTPGSFKVAQQTLVPIRVQHAPPALAPHLTAAISTGVALAVRGPSSNPEPVTGLDYDHYAPMLFDRLVLERLHDEYQQHVTDAAWNKFPSPRDIAFKHLYVHFLIKTDLRTVSSPAQRRHELKASATVFVEDLTQFSLAQLLAGNVTTVYVSHASLRSMWKSEEKDPLNALLAALYSHDRSPYESDMRGLELFGLLLGLALVGLFVSITTGVAFYFDLCHGTRRAHSTKIA